VARACRIGASRSATRKQGLDGRVVRVDRFKRNEIAARNADSLILPWRNRNEAGSRAAIARDNRLGLCAGLGGYDRPKCMPNTSLTGLAAAMTRH
jgi:hypothetical protein